MWRGRRVVLGVTGGIAAYKSVLLARDLTTRGALVDVILTRGATEFVGVPTFEAVTRRPVRTSLWERDGALDHVTLGESADLILVAPATAHLLARAALGMADDLLTATLLAAKAPVLVAPAVRSASAGDRVAVTFHAPARHGTRVILLAPSGRQVRSVPARGRDGTVSLATAGLARGRYEVALVGRHGRVLSRTALRVYPRGEPARIRTTKAGYAVGEPIGVRWSRAPGMALDWVSVFRCTAAGCDGNDAYLVYAYTGNRIAGGLRLGPASVEGNATWPLPPGRYVVRLLVDDGLRSVAQSRRFSVTR